MPGLIRVGHKGAEHVAPGNTVGSFEAALDHGVDMIEFDVLRAPDGRLLLAHDYEDAERPDALTLDEGLDHFAGEAYADVELDVDLKLPGYEREVVEGLRARGLAERALISSMEVESLDRLGELAPDLRRGWSVPRVRRDYTRSPLAPVAYGVARVLARAPARPGRRAHPRRRLRGDHVPLPAREPAPGRAPSHARRRHGLRLDGRRRAHDPASGGDGRRRGDHQRSAAVRRATR